MKVFVQENHPEILKPKEYEGVSIKSTFEILPTIEFEDDFENLNKKLEKIEKPKRKSQSKNKKKKKTKRKKKETPPPPPPPPKPPTPPPPKPPTPPPVEILPPAPLPPKPKFDFSQYKNVHLLYKSYLEKKRVLDTLENQDMEIRPYAWNKDYKISKIKRSMFSKLKLPLMVSKNNKRKVSKDSIDELSNKSNSRKFPLIHPSPKEVNLGAIVIPKPKRRSILRERNYERAYISQPRTEFSDSEYRNRKRNHFSVGKEKHHHSFDGYNLGKNSLKEGVEDRNNVIYDHVRSFTNRPQGRHLSRNRFQNMGEALINDKVSIKFSSPNKFDDYGGYSKRTQNLSTWGSKGYNSSEVEKQLREFDAYLNQEEKEKNNGGKKAGNGFLEMVLSGRKKGKS